MQLPKRKKIRLSDYDYSQNGVYFVTICTYERQCIFGEINNGEITYSDFGKIALLEIENTLMKRAKQNINIIKYVVMPNHVHMIIFIDSKIKVQDRYNEFSKPISNSLSSIIGGYKSSVSKNIHRLIGETDMASHVPTDLKIWQTRYHEHIIRNENSYIEISQYIDNNVLSWDNDKLNLF